MRRRDFVVAASAALASFPFEGSAQRPGRLPTVGFMGTTSLQSQNDWVTAFIQRLGELGWHDQKSINIVYRWAEGRSDHMTAIAAEFVQLKVDAILAVGTEAALIAKKATASIPIVFPFSADPIGTGLVASLARPGGNVTGLSNQARDLGAKRIELMHDALPRVRRIAFMFNAAHNYGRLELAEVQAAARTLGLDEVLPLPIARAQEIDGAIASIKGRADGLYVVADPMMNLNRSRLGTLALEARLPSVHHQRDYAVAGGLMSYGPSFTHLNRRAAEYVDKILRGTKPSDLPIEQPTRFELVINLKTAKALGIDVSPMMLVRADEVIE